MVSACEAAPKGLPSVDPDAQDESLNKLKILVQPLPHSFEAYTGAQFVLVGGKAPCQEGSKYSVVV